MKRVLFAVVLVVALVQLAQPQSSTGTISGTVREQSGAVIPNAEVVLTNTATNVASTGRTNGAGFYFFPGAILGPYRVVAEAPGMGKHEAVFTLQVSQSLVFDAVLKPAQTVTTVEVAATSPMVTVSNATVQSTVEHERIDQLPMTGTKQRMQGSYEKRMGGFYGKG